MGQAESKATESATTLYDRMKPFAGIIKDLPPDFAENHDQTRDPESSRPSQCAALIGRTLR